MAPNNAENTSFQSLILKLHDYWSRQGCVILQPYDMEVGAGTFHPATTLRALGPKPWRAAYVQPSRRPTDGRYGENPNRLQHYYQYQVILKPSPQDSQQLYLDSLAVLGIDAKAHDIRFVEDDWESPTLGAWGLGWEVWCDGMEVSQFTHFADAEKECAALLEGELALPAYDQCLKASHLFNLLDARGVISVTERQAYIARVRALAKGCCDAWVAGDV